MDHTNTDSPVFTELFALEDETPTVDLKPWEAIKNSLLQTINSDDYTSWIEPLTVLNQSNQEIILEAPNQIFIQNIQQRFSKPIKNIIKSMGLEGLSIKFTVSSLPQPEGGYAQVESEQFKGFDCSAKNDQQTDEQKQIEDTYAADTNQKQAFSKSLTLDGNLNRNYTFENFVKGDSNQFAVATCLSASEHPGKAYNPLFIYGSTGLGKTHLLHAVGNNVLKLKPDAVVTYISSERFMNEMIYCIRHNKMWDFRQKYRNCDVFLVDDIQFISGKKSTQEEFFHTFNTLYAAKKQIVITSDLFPKDIPDIEDRLRNRFQWGLIADIQPPSIEHRIAILMSKAEKLGIRLTQDVAEYIAKHAKRNVRILEGALHRINAFAKLQGESITMDLAVKSFKDVLGEAPKRLTIEAVQKSVAEHFKLRVSDLKSKRRQRALAHPRQIAMYLARKLTKASFPEIGDKFGGKDHTTVMHNVKKIEKQLEKDLDLKAHIETLERQLEQLQ